jgi:hypothetical protein
MTNVIELEQHMENAKLLVDRRNMALRLANNPDFKKLILDGFCLHEAARYAQASADPALKVEERADALAMAQASGHLKRFLSVTVQMGAHSEHDMPNIEAALAEARAEELN